MPCNSELMSENFETLLWAAKCKKSSQHQQQIQSLVNSPARSSFQVYFMGFALFSYLF